MKRSISRFLPLGLGLVICSSSACVTKATHEEMQRQHDKRVRALEGSIGERDATVLSLKEALSADEARLVEYEAQVSQLEAQLQQLTADLEAMGEAKDAAETELAEALASKQNLKASIAAMKQALAEASARRAAAEARIAEFRSMLSKFKHLIDAGKLQVQVVDGRMVLVLPTDVLFASGKAKLSDEGIAAVSEVGVTLATMTGRRFQVEGHTDAVPISTAKYPSNWELAYARSMGVVRALLDAGVGPTQISAASYGEYRPVQGNDSDAGKARNRRIEIVIVPDLSGLPGFDELNELARPDGKGR